MMRAGETLTNALEGRGIDRRTFLRFSSLMAAVLALPSRYAIRIAEALETEKLPLLVWLEFQDCAGNSESMLRSGHPTISEIVLDLVSWEYHELIMAGAGHQAESALHRVLEEHAGEFIAVVEGSIPMADDGVYCTIAGRTALDIAREVCPQAAATLAVGACAWDGGLVRSAPGGSTGT